MESTNMQKNKNNTYQPRPCRSFSDEFKKKIVKEIETKRIAVKDVSSLYSVSRNSIYTWLYKYSKNYEKGTKMVLELESEAERTKFLMKKVAELERALGQKTLEIDFLNKVVDLCSEELGYDIKKKASTTLLNGLE
jgi:transposase